MEKSTNAATADTNNTDTSAINNNPSIPLDTPIVRGSQTITDITLRKPMSGELRGCSLADLLQMDVGALARVLPRISQPTLTNADVDKLDPADLVRLGTAILGFLLPKDARASLAA